MAELENGVVKWFNDAKGFGFIEHSSGRDVFVHYSVIDGEGFKTLKDGEEVEYELCEGEKGLHAKRVLRNAAAKAENRAASASPRNSEESAPIAPRLEGGLVNTRHQTAVSMIEVKRESAADPMAPGENTSEILESDLDV